MEHSPSWEANSSSASQATVCHLQTPTVHCRTPKCPPLFCTLSQINPVHIPPQNDILLTFKPSLCQKYTNELKLTQE